MTIQEQLGNFIKLNNLEFTVGRRNTDCVAIIGYSLYIEATKEDLEKVLEDKFSADSELVEEFDRVYDYAKKNNYQNWWKVESNRNTYKLS